MSDTEQKAAGLSKTKNIRVSLQGDDFINYHTASGRIVFKENLSEREADEMLTKIAFRLLGEKVQERLDAGEKFVDATLL